MTALLAVSTTYGLPVLPYTDRAGWAVCTPKKDEPADPDRLTQAGRPIRPSKPLKHLSTPFTVARHRV